MRVKVIFPAIALALLILLPAVYFRFAPTSPAPSAPASQTADTASPSPPAQLPAAHRLWTSGHRDDALPAPAPDRRADPSAPDHQDYIVGRIAQLSELATSNDPVSLNFILAELNNRNPAIRKAALDSTVQFGSQDAIPTLRQELSWTDDPREKMDIQNAIDFLMLPSADSVMSSIMAAQNAGNVHPAN
jgi:hypothetical protein